MLKIEDAIVNDGSIAQVLEYIREACPDAYGYVANEHLDRFLFTASYITGNFPPTSKVLDIGSHPFFLPGYLSLKGFESISTADIDRPDDFPLDPKWKVRSVKADIEKEPLPFEDGSFDLVLLLEVFEHLYRQPNHVFREIRRVLKPGGRVMISTPNGGKISNYIKCLMRGEFGAPMYDFSSVYEKLGHFAHIREYSVREIKRYLHRVGFSTEEVTLRTFYPTKISNDNRIHRVVNAPKVLIRRVFGFLPVFQTNIFLVARKPAG